MILVVDGISANGKATSCAKHGGHMSFLIMDVLRTIRLQDPVEAATFRAERNVDRDSNVGCSASLIISLELPITPLRHLQ